MNLSDTMQGCISIHSLVKRETVLYCSTGLQSQYFNPLPRKEGDRKYS